MSQYPRRTGLINAVNHYILKPKKYPILNLILEVLDMVLFNWYWALSRLLNRLQTHIISTVLKNYVCACHNGPQLGQNLTDAGSIGPILDQFLTIMICCRFTAENSNYKMFFKNGCHTDSYVVIWGINNGLRQLWSVVLLLVMMKLLLGQQDIDFEYSNCIQEFSHCVRVTPCGLKNRDHHCLR